MMNKFLEILENELVQSGSIEDCQKSLERFLKTQHISTYSFTYYAHHPDSAAKLKYDISSKNYTHWHKHYVEAEYNKIDSLMDFVYNQQLPIYWNVRQQLAQAKNENERKMRLASLEFGTESGLSIPIHAAHDNFAILLIVCMQGDTGDLKDPNLQYTFLVAAHLFYHYLQIHLLNNTSEKTAYHLTMREIQCLLLIAKQYSVLQMAQELELSERTINFHIQKINKKLGTKNKYQSLAKCLKLGLLTL